MLDRVDDVGIAGASAEVAFDRVRDFRARRFGIVLQELNASHNHPRRAVAALEAVALPEALLHGVQLAIARQAFNRGDFGAVGLHGEHGAGLGRFAIEQDGAGAADTGFATDMRPRQAAEVAEKMDEEHSRLDFMLMRSSVDANVERSFHSYRRSKCFRWTAPV